MKTDSINLTVTKTRACPVLAQKWGEKSLTITATAKAYTWGGNAHPHFSVTAEVFRMQDGYKSEIAGGCLHEEVLHYFPQMAPLVALHLSNADDGEPMHAEANGFYWLAGAFGGFGEQYHGGSGSSAKSPEECLRIFAEHVRIGIPEAEEIGRAVVAAFEQGKRSVATSEEVTETCRKQMEKAGRAAAKALWKTCCDAMRPRWQQEAQAGLALLESMMDSATPATAVL